MHYQKNDDNLKPYVDLVRSKAETKDKVLALAKSRQNMLEQFCIYVKAVLSEKNNSLDDDTLKRISCIALSTYGFYF